MAEWLRWRPSVQASVPQKKKKNHRKVIIENVKLKETVVIPKIESKLMLKRTPNRILRKHPN
jgi:hypothetical protein